MVESPNLDLATLPAEEVLKEPNVMRFMRLIHDDVQDRLRAMMNSSYRKFSEADKRDIVLLLRILKDHGETGDVTSFSKTHRLFGNMLSDWRKAYGDKSPEELVAAYFASKKGENGDVVMDPEERERLLAELAALEEQLPDESHVATPDVKTKKEAEESMDSETPQEWRVRLMNDVKRFLEDKDIGEVSQMLVGKAGQWNEENILKMLRCYTLPPEEIRVALENAFSLTPGCFTYKPGERLVQETATPENNTEPASPKKKRGRRTSGKKNEVAAPGEAVETDVVENDAMPGASDTAPQALVVSTQPQAEKVVPAGSFQMNVEVSHEDENGQTSFNFNTTNPGIALGLQQAIAALFAGKKTNA